MTDTLRRTPLFERHRELGARFVPFVGWEMPVQYEGVTREHQAVRTAAGLFDVSHMGELFLSGEGAVTAVDRLITNDAQGLKPGRALYTACCKDRSSTVCSSCMSGRPLTCSIKRA